MTAAEAGELWNLGTSTVKRACQTGRFLPYEARKSGGTWLVTIQGMERVYGKRRDKKMIKLNGKEYEMEVAANYMDDDLREEIHRELAPCTDQEFIDEYAKRHLEKFEEEFTVD